MIAGYIWWCQCVNIRVASFKYVKIITHIQQSYVYMSRLLLNKHFTNTGLYCTVLYYLG